MKDKRKNKEIRLAERKKEIKKERMKKHTYKLRKKTEKIKERKRGREQERVSCLSQRGSEEKVLEASVNLSSILL